MPPRRRSTEPIARMARRDPLAYKPPRIDKETAERAWRAVKEFRRIQPGLTAFARALTGRSDVRVQPSPDGGSSTDGKTIYLPPAIELGDVFPHDRLNCDKRNYEGRQICNACDRDEVILYYLSHEIAHIACDSFADPDRFSVKAVEAIVKEWHPRGACSHSGLILGRVRSAESCIEMMGAVHPFLSILQNALDDARVNAEAARARPGLKTLFEVGTLRIFDRGVTQIDGTVDYWCDKPVNSQIVVGLFLQSAGYHIKEGYLAEEVMNVLSDARIRKITDEVPFARSVHDVTALAAQAFRTLNEMGYVQAKKCVKPPPPPPPPPAPPVPGEAGEKDDTPSDKGEPSEDSSSGGESEEGSKRESESEESDGKETDKPRSESSSDSGSSGDPSEPDDSGESEPNGAGGSSDGDESGAGGDDSSPDPESGDGEGDTSAGSTGAGGSSTSSPGGEGDDDDSGTDGSSGAPPSGSGSDETEQGAGGEASRGETEGSDSESKSGRPESSGGSDDRKGDKGEGSDPTSAEGSASSGDDGGDDRHHDGSPEGEDGSSDGSPDTTGTDHPSSEMDGGSPVGESGPEASTEAPESDAGRGDGTGESASSEGEPEFGPNADGEEDSSDDDGEAGGPDEGSAGEPDEARSGADGDATPGPGSNVDEELSDEESEPTELRDLGDYRTVGKDVRDFGIHGLEDHEPLDPVEDTAERGRGDIEGRTPVVPRSRRGRPASRVEAGEPDGEEFKHSHTEDMARYGDLDSDFRGDRPAMMRENDANAIKVALVQEEHFESPSVGVSGVRIYKHGDIGWVSSRNNTPENYQPDEGVMGRAILEARLAFEANKRQKHQHGLKSGPDISRRLLGRRAPLGDERIFSKKLRITKRDYFVVFCVDISGSTGGRTIEEIKRAVFAQAHLVARLGHKFAIYAFSGEVERGAYSLVVCEVKTPEDPWSPQVQQRLADLRPISANLDGHNLHFARRICDTRQETDRIIMYYSDGSMPCENYEEELALLQDELVICKRKRYPVVGVGVGTDAPRRHGLDTVRYDRPEDLIKVVKKIGEYLTED